MKERAAFVTEIQKLLRTTDCNNVTVKYGYAARTDDGNVVFTESEIDIDSDDDITEAILVKFDSKPDDSGVIQDISGDSLYWILHDILNTIKLI